MFFRMGGELEIFLSPRAYLGAPAYMRGELGIFPSLRAYMVGGRKVRVFLSPRAYMGGEKLRIFPF